MNGNMRCGCSVILAIVFALAVMVPANASSDFDSAAAAWAAADLEFVRNPSTGAVAFLSSKKGLDSGATDQELRATPSAAVGKFLSRYHKFLGMFNATNELVLQESTIDRLGMNHVLLKQIHRGIPVFGAEVRLHFFAGSSRIRALGGSFIPYLAINTEPALSSEAAIAVVRKIQDSGELWEEPVLQIYSGHIDRFVSGNHLAWLIRIFDESQPSRNLYVVDAHSGELLTSYNELDTIRDRIIHNTGGSTNLPGPIAREEGDPPTGDADTDDAYDYLGGYLRLFFQSFRP